MYGQAVLYACMYACMDGWIDGWMDVWMHVYIYDCLVFGRPGWTVVIPWWLV